MRANGSFCLPVNMGTCILSIHGRVSYQNKGLGAVPSYLEPLGLWVLLMQLWGWNPVGPALFGHSWSSYGCSGGVGPSAGCHSQFSASHGQCRGRGCLGDTATWLGSGSLTGPCHSTSSLGQASGADWQVGCTALASVLCCFFLTCGTLLPTALCFPGGWCFGGRRRGRCGLSIGTVGSSVFPLPSGAARVASLS